MSKEVSRKYWAVALIVALGATAILAIHGGQLIYSDHARGEGSFVEKLASSPPNEIGDTLAGIFGTLAFLVATIAIFLQTLELSAQRQELKLTRSELEGQKVASQEMARAMKQQTEILKDERRYRDEARAYELFVAKQKRLESIVRHFLLQEGVSRSATDACHFLRLEENQHHVTDALLDFYANLPKILPPNEIMSYSDGAYIFFGLASEVREIVDEMQNLALDEELSVGEIENVLALGLDSLLGRLNCVVELHSEICKRLNGAAR